MLIMGESRRPGIQPQKQLELLNWLLETPAPFRPSDRQRNGAGPDHQGHRRRASECELKRQSHGVNPAKKIAAQLEPLFLRNFNKAIVT